MIQDKAPEKLQVPAKKLGCTGGTNKNSEKGVRWQSSTSSQVASFKDNLTSNDDHEASGIRLREKKLSKKKNLSTHKRKNARLDDKYVR